MSLVQPKRILLEIKEVPWAKTETRKTNRIKKISEFFQHSFCLEQTVRNTSSLPVKDIFGRAVSHKENSNFTNELMKPKLLVVQSVVRGEDPILTKLHAVSHNVVYFESKVET